MASCEVPTRAERTALLFLAAVLLAGGLVRLGRAVGAGKRPPAAAVALAEQQRVLDSAAQARRERAERQAPATPQAGRSAATRAPINVNRASAAELEALPRIGPALAARIVAEREASGPFPTVDALQLRVKGIGPALARTIAPHVTFSPY